MRKRLLYYTPLLLFFLHTSITAHTQLQKIYLNPKAAGSENQSQFVDSIRFIPLEVKEDIDLSSFTDVTVTPNHFLIIDYPEQAILLYSKQGTFIRKIRYKKLGENFTPDYYEHKDQIVFFGENKNYSLTAKDRIKIMLDWNNPRNQKYFKKYRIDLSDSTLTIQKDSPNENDILQANHLYKDYYWRGQVNTSPLYKDSLDYELKIYKDNQLVKAFFPYNRVSEPRFLFAEASLALNNTGVAEIFTVMRPFCDTIYKLIKDSLFPAYQLIMPLENSLPPSFYTKPFKNKTERENFKRNNGLMFQQVYQFYETDRFIFFGVGYFTNYETYLYKKQTQTSFRAKNIKPDSSQYNLSLFEDFGLQRNGNVFYKSLKAADLLPFFEQHKTVPVPKELADFLKSKPADNSPVIVEFKLKN